MSEKCDWSISSDHKRVLDELFLKIENENINQILDIGTGRTSLKYLTDKYPKARIEAITYPGDIRKISSIKDSIDNDNYILIEADLKEYKNNSKYDIVLAHLLLGEASKFNGNTFEGILKKIFEINSKYLIIVDYKEDLLVDYIQIENYAAEDGLILNKIELKRTEEISFDGFLGRTFKGYLIKK